MMNHDSIMPHFGRECQKQMENGEWKMENCAGGADGRKQKRRPSGRRSEWEVNGGVQHPQSAPGPMGPPHISEGE